jgi:hypothetical protein
VATVSFDSDSGSKLHKQNDSLALMTTEGNGCDPSALHLSTGLLWTDNSDIHLRDEWLDMYGLYSPSRGFWLENDRYLSDYDIPLISMTSRLRASSLWSSGTEVIELQHRHHFVRTLSFAHYAEGWLEKKGDKSIMWKERFFVLRGRTLYYYKAREDHSPIGSIDLNQGFQLKSPLDQQFPSHHLSVSPIHSLSFHLETSQKTYRLRAPDVRETSHWLRILKSIRNELRQESGLGPAPSPAPSDPPEDIVPAPNDNWDTSSSSSSDADSDCSDVDRYIMPHVSLSTTYRPMDVLGTFGHLRLSDAVRRPVSSHSKRPTSLIAPPPQTNVDIQGDKIGFLYKKGNVNKAMKLRLFVLRDKILYYYRQTTNTKITSTNRITNSNFQYAGMMNLEGCRIFGDRKRGKKAHLFRIVTPSRVYVVSTNDVNEWNDWHDAFEFICGIVVEDQSRTPPSSVESNPVYQEIASSDDEIDERSATASKPHKQKLCLNFSDLGMPEFQGTLWKRGNDRLGKWRRRWFVLVGRTLFYCKNRAHLEPIGSIPLSICSLKKPAEGTSTPACHSTCYTSTDQKAPMVQHPLNFDLVLLNDTLTQPTLRVYHLHAETFSEYTEWIRHIAIHTKTDKATIQQLISRS